MAIQIKKDGTEISGLVDDNVIQPFSLEKSNVRGRMVRLGSVLTDIMDQHQYPAPVASLLSEIVTLCIMLSGMIKYDGVFSLQVKSEGAIKSMVADVTSEGEVRAYAGFDEEAIIEQAKNVKGDDTHFYSLLGTGYMAFTVKSNSQADQSYQGIVALQGESILKDVEHYFEQSEQLQTSFKTAIHPQDGFWRAGGIMIQNMPAEATLSKEKQEEAEEDWNRPSVMLSTCKDDEIVSPNLHSADVLFRLFHEDGVRVYSPKPLRFGCQCSRSKVEGVIATLSKDDIDHLFAEEDEMSVKCEFCSAEYKFTETQVNETVEKRKKSKESISEGECYDIE